MKLENLISQIRSLSKDLRFQELKKALESLSYTIRQPKTGGSHCTFRKQGKMPITTPKNEPIKIVYVKMVKEVIEQEEMYNK